MNGNWVATSSSQEITSSNHRDLMYNEYSTIDNTAENRAQNFFLGLGHALGNLLGTHEMDEAPLDRWIDRVLPESWKSWFHSFSPQTDAKKIDNLQGSDKIINRDNLQELDKINVLELVTSPEADWNGAFNKNHINNRVTETYLESLGHNYHRIDLFFDGANVCPVLETEYSDSKFSIVILSTHGNQYGIAYPSMDIKTAPSMDASSDYWNAISNDNFNEALVCLARYLKPDAKIFLNSCSTGSVSTLPLLENYNPISNNMYPPGNFALTLYRFFSAHGRSLIEVLAPTEDSYGLFIESVYPLKAISVGRNQGTVPYYEAVPFLESKNLLVRYNSKSSHLIEKGYDLLNERPDPMLAFVFSLFSKQDEYDIWHQAFSKNSNDLVKELGYDPNQELELHEYRAFTKYCEIQGGLRSGHYESKTNGNNKAQLERLEFYKNCVANHRAKYR